MLRDAVVYFADQKEHDYATDWRDVVMKKMAQYDVEYKYSQKPPSKKDERLKKEREELDWILGDIGLFLDDGDDPSEYPKHKVIERWCEATGHNERQFRRRLAEMPEDIQQTYDRLPDRRMK